MRDRKYGAFFYLFIYNLLILIIPTLIAMASYQQSYAMLSNKIVAHANTLLQQSRNVIDERLSRIQEMSTKIALESEVVNYVSYTQPQSVDSIYSNYLIDKTFREWISINPFVERIFIYYEKPYVILSNQDNAYSPEVFFQREQRSLGYDREIWMERLKTAHSFTIYPVEAQSGDIAMVFFQNIPITMRGAGHDKMGICLRPSLVQDALSVGDQNDQELVYIVNSKNEILYADGNEQLLSMHNFDPNQAQANTTQAGPDGEQYMVSHVTSAQTDWQHVSVVPISSYMKQLNDVRKQTILFAGCALVVGLVLCLSFARQSYRPLNRITRSVLDDMGIGDPKRKERNEWNIIESAFSQYKSETATYAKTLKSQRTALREGLLHKLIMQDVTAMDNGKELLSTADLGFLSDSFLCADMIWSRLDACTEQDEFPRHITEQLLTEFVKPIGYVDVIDMKRDNYACIFCLHSALEQPEERVMEVLTVLRKELHERFSLTITSALGDAHRGLGGISLSYGEALKAREYMRFLEGETIYCYRDIRGVEEKYYYPIETELQLISYVKQGDVEKVTHLLEEVFDRNFGVARPSFEMARCLLFEIMSTALKIMSDFSLSTDILFSSGIQPFDLLFQSESVSDMLDTSMLIFHRLCICIAENQGHQSASKIDAILAYVEEQYANPAFSMGMVADHFRMNSAYLSYFFREQTGEKFTDYFRRFRIEKVKQLLQDTKFSVAAIAECVGYSNSNVLIRNFKRETGITPVQYRERLG